MENNLRKIRESLNLSQDEAAERLGTSRSQYVKLERGERRMSDVWIERASKGFGVTPGAIIDSSFIDKNWKQPQLELTSAEFTQIPIRGEVAAGLWREIDELSQDRWSENNQHHVEYAPTIVLPGYPPEQQFGLYVRGESLNKIAPDGSVLHCLEYINGDAWHVKDGELVVVQRTKYQGAMIETTAKRVRRNGDIFELWPESNHPDFQEPLIVPGYLDAESTEEIRIFAKVLKILIEP